jgi:RNA polymerase sigma factor (sigma-70 family)
MALTAKVESRLRQLFKEKTYYLTHNTSVEEGLKSYFKYRNLICQELYDNTLDLAEAKKRTWWNKHQIDEGDCISILTDSIFKAADTYDENKTNKFVTYFYRIMENTLKNHLKYLSTKRKTSIFNEASFKEAAKQESKRNGIKNKETHERNIEQTCALSEALDREGTVDMDSALNAKDSVRYMLKNVKGKEKKVLVGLLKGRTNREIAKKIKTSPRYVGLLIEKIQRKFKRIERELCQNENLY